MSHGSANRGTRSFHVTNSIVDTKPSAKLNCTKELTPRLQSTLRSVVNWNSIVFDRFVTAQTENNDYVPGFEDPPSAIF